jgi:hypothetical protein
VIKLEINASNWRYNSEKGVIELLVSIPNQTEELVIIVTETALSEIMDLIPSLQEERQIRDLLNKIKNIQQQRLLTIEDIDKKADELRNLHAKIRDELSQPNISKNDILAISAKSKDLSAEKAVLETKRHLVRMLAMEESKLRAELAKILVGRANAS